MFWMRGLRWWVCVCMLVLSRLSVKTLQNSFSPDIVQVFVDEILHEAISVNFLVHTCTNKKYLMPLPKFFHKR
jgi:hypothetical protein